MDVVLRIQNVLRCSGNKRRAGDGFFGGVGDQSSQTQRSVNNVIL